MSIAAGRAAGDAVMRESGMADVELEFDGALLGCSGFAESLHAAGADARVCSYGEAGEWVDDAWPEAPDLLG